MHPSLHLYTSDWSEVKLHFAKGTHACLTPVRKNTVYRLRRARAQICFDKPCQDQADALFAVSVVAPIIVALGLYFGWLQKSKGKKEVFRSIDGTAFESLSGVGPARDRRGDLVYRPVSYTPWPVEEDVKGERLRIEIGPVSDRKKTTFVFDRLLSSSSQILAVTLPRPMGIILEEDGRTGRTVIADLIEGSAAYQRSQISKLNGQETLTAQKGDILRACTCTNIVYESTALIGAKAPLRTIVLYGADNQKWPQVINALKQGNRSDGPVTLVLERQ